MDHPCGMSNGQPTHVASAMKLLESGLRVLTELTSTLSAEIEIKPSWPRVMILEKLNCLHTQRQNQRL